VTTENSKLVMKAYLSSIIRCFVLFTRHLDQDEIAWL